MVRMNLGCVLKVGLIGLGVGLDMGDEEERTASYAFAGSTAHELAILVDVVDILLEQWEGQLCCVLR